MHSHRSINIYKKDLHKVDKIIAWTQEVYGKIPLLAQELIAIIIKSVATGGPTKSQLKRT